MIRRLRQVDGTIYELVHNEGDLTQTLDVHTGDEMEMIAGNVNELLQYRETLDAMKTAVGECAIGVTNVTETAVSLTENVCNIGKEAEFNLEIAVRLNDEVGKFKL